MEWKATPLFSLFVAGYLNKRDFLFRNYHCLIVMRSWIVLGWVCSSVPALSIVHPCTHKPNEAGGSLSSSEKAKEKVFYSCCLWLLGKMPVFEESQTCSGNFSGNQRCRGGFSCIPGLSRCVQSMKQALMLTRYSCQLLSFHLQLVRNFLWKVFLLEESKSLPRISATTGKGNGS